LTTNINENLQTTLEYFYKSNNLPEEIKYYDKNFNNFENKFKNWLEQFETEHQSIFLHLFNHYRYFDKNNIEKWFHQSYELYKSVEPTFDESIYIPVTSIGGIMNGAIHMIHEFDMIGPELGISRKRIAAQPIEFNNSFKISTSKNIVLIDDIVGTGDTLIDFVIGCKKNKHTKNLFENKRIYIFALAVSEKTKNRVIDDLKVLGIKGEFINNLIINKAFEKGFIYHEEEARIKAKNIVEKYEELAAPEPKYAMGYKNSQALVSFYFNTPNNSLSTFWEINDEKPWVSFFPRRKDDYEFELDPNVSITLKEIKNERKRVRKIAAEIDRQKQAEMKRRGIGG
jgi:hypothetical protein